MKVWNWKKGGIAIGVLSIIAVFLVKPLGASTEYVIVDGMILKGLFPDFIQSNLYFAKYADKLTVSYGMMVVIGMAIGAVISVLTGGKKAAGEEKSVPGLWAKAFGKSKGKRYTAAFIGGFLVLFGARLAGGCTSGHIISGMAQLSISGFIFAAAVFMSGIPTARLLYRRVREGR